MAWRPATSLMTLPVIVTVCLAGLLAPVALAADGDPAANVRIATYQTESGDEFFAASVLPSAADELIAAVSDARADVVIVVDTSATQSGGFRTDSINAVNGIVDQLRPDDRVRLYAGDVKAVDLTGDFTTPVGIDSAMDRLKRRLPLGNTNMIAVIDSARAALVAVSPQHTRSLVYIGDGTSIDAMQHATRFEALVDALRADRIAVHAVAIGPVANVELMGVLANQTGGVVGVVGDKFPVDTVASSIGSAATRSPIWVDSAKLPEGFVSVHGDRVPPLRLDRDSILIGRIDTQRFVGDQTHRIAISGSTTSAYVAIETEVTVESSHEDFGFLPGLVKLSGENQGLTLPSAGSPMLREAARALGEKSRQLSKAATMALQRGNKRGAKVVADMAVEADPSNEEARVIQGATADQLIAQFGDDSDDLFEGGFGDDETASDDDVFGEQADAPETAAPPIVAPTPVAPDTTAPAPVAPAGMPATGFASPVGDDDLMESSSGLLERIRGERSVAEGRLRAEVRAQLSSASRQIRTDPVGVAGSLKSLLSNVETAPDINPQLRQELIGQIRSGIRSAAAAEARYVEASTNLEQRAAAASAQQRLLAETFRREATLQALSSEMNALIDEGRYAEADGEVTIPFARLAGDTITRDSVAGRHFRDEPLMLQVFDRDQRYRELRERNFVDAFSLVLKANIPFVDEPPVMYPDSDFWQRMSRRRLERYGAIELVGDNETERRIETTLNDETSFNFIDTPLQDAIQQISRKHDIPIIIDENALEEIGLSSDEPVNLSLQNVSLRSFIRLMLRKDDLTYVIADEVMQITTQEAAEENLVTKVYPVGDLVVPVMALGGGMMGGGMGGGMMGGGMGGGMGGMGGGMGGGMMGGGMGGGMMGGGMGGGMMAVPDDSSLSDKASGTAATDEPKTPRTSANTNLTSLKVKRADGESWADAYASFFAEQDLNSAEDLAILDTRVRSTVRLLSTRADRLREDGDVDAAADQFAQARDLIAASLRAGHAQPWMYMAYAITLKATEAPAEEIERSLLSAVDFAESVEDVLNVAGRLEAIGSNEAALKLCQDIAAMDPYRREPYVMGLRLAKRIDQTDAMAWACRGVLSQAWPAKYESLRDEAKVLARVTYDRLIASGNIQQADAFNRELKLAASHDVIVRVTWTGEADLDIAVEEPAGTLCTLESTSSAGGGTLLGDAFAGGSVGTETEGQISETYLCPEGFSGRYKLLIRRVWGEITTGQATVEILTDVGRPSQRFIKQQIPVAEKDALVIFEVKDGKRQEEIGEAQLAQLRDVQSDLAASVLGQFVVPGDPAGNAADFFNPFAAAAAMGSRGARGGFGPGGAFFGRPGAVGFQPQTTVLPEGANLFTLAIISADRRYVRISPAPMFSQVLGVSTFNFVTGDAGGDPAGGGLGGGLGGGGFGGGGGGGGGLGGGGVL